MDNYLKVEGHANYYRDPESKAILIVDENKRQNYLNQRTTIEKNNQNYEHINNEVHKLKQDINDIKAGIQSLIESFKQNKADGS